MKQIPKPPVAMKTATIWLASVLACSESESGRNSSGSTPSVHLCVTGHALSKQIFLCRHDMHVLHDMRNQTKSPAFL